MNTNASTQDRSHRKRVKMSVEGWSVAAPIRVMSVPVEHNKDEVDRIKCIGSLKSKNFFIHVVEAGKQ